MSRKLEKHKIGLVRARSGHVNHAKAGLSLGPCCEMSSPPRRTNRSSLELAALICLKSQVGRRKSSASSLGSESDLSAARSALFYSTDVLARRATRLTFM